MKKILIPVLSLLMAAFAVSCTEQEPDYSGMRAVLGIEVADMQDLYQVNKRQQKTVNLKVTAEEISGTTLNVIIGVNPDLVATYNEAHGTDYVMLPAEAYSFVDREVMLPRFNKISSLGVLNLIGKGCVSEKTYLLPVVIEKVDGSENYELSETSVAYFVFKINVPVGGDGSPEDPYQIKELKDLVTINEKMLSGDISYFSLQNDIDMSSVTDWVRINSSPYNAQIHFEGNGHKIMNYKGTTGLFHVLYGTMQNVTFENCEVTGAKNTGLLADYLGYIKDANTYPAHLKNVNFKNCKFTGGGNDSGLLCAYAYSSLAENVYMENCECTFAARRHGFFAGRIEGGTAEFKNCYVKGGKVIKGTQQVGGLVGQNNDATLIVSNCGFSAEFEGTNRNMGAILAYAKTDSALGGDGTTTITNCLVWTPNMTCATNTGDLYSSGVVVGCSEQAAVTYKNCLRRSDLVFKEYMEGMNDLVDNADVENTAVVSGSVGTHNFPYHGKAAAAGVTASQAAKQLGWDEAIWDLNGAEPMLK